jgi:hypothetical protein
LSLRRESPYHENRCRTAIFFHRGAGASTLANSRTTDETKAWEPQTTLASSKVLSPAKILAGDGGHPLIVKSTGTDKPVAPNTA